MGENADMNIRPVIRPALLLAALLVLLGACSSGGGAAWTYSPPLPTASGSPGTSPGGSPGTSPGGSPGTSPGGSPGTSPGGSPGTSPGGSPGTSPGGSPGTSPGGSPGTSPGASPSASVQPTAAPSGSGRPQPSGTAGTGEPIVIDIEETADLKILSGGQQITELRVRPGQAYTFRVTNTAGYPHNFFIGAPDDLEANNKPELTGVDDFNSGTQEFTYTFEGDPAQFQFACTVPGHYPLMHGNFVAEQ
jgi:hypothetical protein